MACQGPIGPTGTFARFTLTSAPPPTGAIRYPAAPALSVKSPFDSKNVGPGGPNGSALICTCTVWFVRCTPSEAWTTIVLTLLAGVTGSKTGGARNRISPLSEDVNRALYRPGASVYVSGTWTLCVSRSVAVVR